MQYLSTTVQIILFLVFAVGGTIDKVYFDALSKYEIGESNINDILKSNDIEISNAEATLRADTLIEVDQEMAEKILKIMDFMDDLDDVQEVHTNAQFPDNFEPGE